MKEDRCCRTSRRLRLAYFQWRIKFRLDCDYAKESGACVCCFLRPLNKFIDVCWSYVVKKNLIFFFNFWKGSRSKIRLAN